MRMSHQCCCYGSDFKSKVTFVKLIIGCHHEKGSTTGLMLSLVEKLQANKNLSQQGVKHGDKTVYATVSR